MQCWNEARAWVREREPLAGKTSWRIGGHARWYAEPEDEIQLATLLREAERAGIRVRFLGGGCNLLVGDGEIDGLVIRLPRTGPFGAITASEDDDGRYAVGAAVPLPQLLTTLADHGRTGLEDLAGVPGSVGGALQTNAGIGLRGIGAYVTSVSGFDMAGRPVALGQHELNFGYRSSNLDGLIVTSVQMRLRRGKPEEIRRTMQELREVKTARQPLDQPSAGCVFRNPPDRPAALLIDQAGLKGMRVGGAEVSRRHANFIVNNGGATCADVMTLIARVRERVLERYRVELEMEVRLWL